MTNTLQWPELPLEAWEPTRITLHRWTQVIGKIRLALTPYMNHCWQVPLYVCARGLTTSPIPYKGEAFEIIFDFIDHKLVIQKTDGMIKTLPLAPKPVSAFYAEVMDTLRAMGIEVSIWTTPVEIPNPVPFEQDHANASYDAEYVSRFWRVLLSVDTVLKEFRGRYIGKSSPVHFFWGSFDIAVTRFSGRTASLNPAADSITQEAYSHEVSSVGWWPGDHIVREPAFYAYAAPEPYGFKTSAVLPSRAFYNENPAEFLLKYEDMRNYPSPREALLDFCQSTYEAAAICGKWDRAELEKPTAST